MGFDIILNQSCAKGKGSSRNEEKASLYQTFTKIKKIDGPKSKNRSIEDFIVILRASFLGRAYRKYLKKYASVRWFTRLFWFYGYSICFSYLSKKFKYKFSPARPIINLRKFSKENSLQIYKIQDEIIVEPQAPIVYPKDDISCLRSSQYSYKSPEIYVSVIKKGMIYGNSNLIMVDDKVICHDLYDLTRDYTSEELHCRAVIKPKSKRIKWFDIDKNPVRVSSAATFTDACAHNYAHWLSEVFPRIVLFCNDQRFRHIPIVINDGLHKNIMESLLIAAGADREIFLLPLGKAICCDRLYIVSATGYVPFDRRINKLSNYSHGVFSPFAFNTLQKHFFNKLRFFENNHLWPEKIFLSRNSAIRRCINSPEIEKQLSNIGYKIIDPEKLSFLQQVQMFKNAKKIISPTGAGLVNAIFCMPETKVGILMAKHEKMIYRYWNNMLASRHLKMYYLLGEITRNKHLGIHGDFFVNPKDFTDFMEAIEADDS